MVLFSTVPGVFLDAFRCDVTARRLHRAGDDSRGDVEIITDHATHDPCNPEANRPQLSAVVRHLTLSLLTANIIPTVLFYLFLVAGNVWMALVAAMVWCYAALAWRVGTRRRTSALLWVTLVGLTAKTGLAFASGSTFVYFLQPALTDLGVALVFLVSLITAQPFVGRLAADFYPMDADLAGRPRIQRLFWRLTLLWATICGVKALLSLWLLEALSTSSYIAVKTVLGPAAAVAGAALTVFLAVRVARHEGLLHPAARLAPLPS